MNWLIGTIDEVISINRSRFATGLQSPFVYPCLLLGFDKVVHYLWDSGHSILLQTTTAEYSHRCAINLSKKHSNHPLGHKAVTFTGAPQLFDVATAAAGWKSQGTSTISWTVDNFKKSSQRRRHRRQNRRRMAPIGVNKGGLAPPDFL